MVHMILQGLKELRMEAQPQDAKVYHYTSGAPKKIPKSNWLKFLFMIYSQWAISLMY